MKKQVTYNVADKYTFSNEVEVKEVLQFLLKAEETVKLYNRHSKALKEYMVKNGLNDLTSGEFHAHISEGTARKTDDNDKLNAFLKSVGRDRDEFKKLGNPPKSLELYRD